MANLLRENEGTDVETLIDLEANAHGSIASLIDACARRAAEGDVDAMFELGLVHSTGGQAPLDYVAAHKWLNLAAMAGSLEARCLRAELAQGMSAAEIAEAQRQARAWQVRRLH